MARLRAHDSRLVVRTALVESGPHVLSQHVARRGNCIHERLARLRLNSPKLARDLMQVAVRVTLDERLLAERVLQCLPDELRRPLYGYGRGDGCQRDRARAERGLPDEP